MPNRTPPTNLKIFYQNVRGLRTKTHEFYTSTSDISFNIVIITESWLCSSIFNNKLFPHCNTVMRNDRKFSSVGRSTGGGVLFATLNNYNFQQIDTTHISNLVPLVDIIMCKYVTNAATVFFTYHQIYHQLTCFLLLKHLHRCY